MDETRTSIEVYFGELTDPRVERTKRHGLLDIITLALCGVICGAESWVGQRISHETRYYLSSVSGSAQDVGAAVRAHWGVENQVYWVLDVAFREDECRVRS